MCTNPVDDSSEVHVSVDEGASVGGVLRSTGGMSERVHPREQIRSACAAHGEDAVVDWCVDLITGEVSPAAAYEPDLLPKLKWISGPLAGGWGRLDPVNYYWVRVWAVRAFLYVWRDDVVDALFVAADDPAWRVREHVARIVAQRELGQLVDPLLPLLDHTLPASARPAYGRSERQGSSNTSRRWRGCVTIPTRRSGSLSSRLWTGSRSVWTGNCRSRPRRRAGDCLYRSESGPASKSARALRRRSA